MRLLLVRHGESRGNTERRIQGWNDDPLTERGRAQAAAIARRLAATERIDAIYASPLVRARDTAEAIAAAQGRDLDVILDGRLRERGYGALAGLCFDEVDTHFPEIAQQRRLGLWYATVPGEEEHAAFHRRVSECIGEIVAHHKGHETIAVVAHMGPLASYLVQLVGLDCHQPSPWLFDNASLSIVLVESRRSRIILLNDTCHLNDLGTTGEYRQVEEANHQYLRNF